MSKYRLLHLGITDDMDYEYQRVTMLSNVVYLLILGIVALFLLINSLRYADSAPSPPQEFWIPFGLLVISLTGLLLNYWLQRLISKLLFVFTWIFFSIVLVPLFRGATEASFVSVGIYAIISSVMVQILFSWRRERVVYVGMVILTTLIVIFFVEFLEAYRVTGDENILFQSGFSRWRFLIVMVAIFLNGAIIYMVRINNRLNESLIRRNQVIEEQNRQLAEQQESLVALTMRLREKVDSTHEQLNEQNLKLTEFTYFNSHILRAPVSRIRGLINLLSLKLSQQEEAEVRTLLAKSMKDLDDAIKGITGKLSDSERSD